MPANYPHENILRAPEEAHGCAEASLTIDVNLYRA